MQVILFLLQSGLVVWMTLYGFWWGMAPPYQRVSLILFYEGVVKASCENSQIGFERITVAWMKRSGIRGKVQVILGLLQSGLVVYTESSKPLNRTAANPG